VRTRRPRNGLARPGVVAAAAVHWWAARASDVGAEVEQDLMVSKLFVREGVEEGGRGGA
jgi:hypothetical protein